MIATVRDDPTVVDLVERARNGDRSAWDEIVERYSPLVWSKCRQYGLTGADADDVGAAVWLRLVEGLAALREPAALPGWLGTTTYRECLHVLRTKQRQIPVEHDDLSDATLPESDEWLLKQERQIALRSSFGRLSDRCRQLLGMLFREPPATYAEISAELGMAVGAIGPNRQRCLDRLRAMPEFTALIDRSSGASSSRMDRS